MCRDMHRFNMGEIPGETLRSSVHKRLNRDAIWAMDSDGPKESCVAWGSRRAEGRCHLPWQPFLAFYVCDAHY